MQFIVGSGRKWEAQLRVRYTVDGRVGVSSDPDNNYCKHIQQGSLKTRPIYSVIVFTGHVTYLGYYINIDYCKAEATSMVNL